MPADGWLALDFEALRTAAPTEIDPRAAGEALWPARHDAALLRAKRALDPLRFECMYQGRPSVREGLLYGDQFAEYDTLPREIVRRANYTDTADTGDDYLCSVSYAVDADGVIYVTDLVYSRERMEVTEGEVADLLLRSHTRTAAVESNNGGRGFAVPCSGWRRPCAWSGSTRAPTRRRASSPIRPRCCIRCECRGAGISAGRSFTPI